MKKTALIIIGILLIWGVIIASRSSYCSLCIVRLEYSNGLVENGVPHIFTHNTSATGKRMIRVVSKPYPIYTEQPDGDVQIRFKRERVWINDRLQGLVFKNYEDFERNEGDLGGIEHLMCHGRLADDRVNQYLAKMTSLKAITILSPMPADLEKIHKYFPSIRALDLNCAYWPCKYDLSLFGELESISIRGKHWLSLYEMNRSIVRRMSGIYLESATPEDIREVPENVSSYELTLNTDQDYIWMYDAKSKLKSCRSLTLNIGTMPVVKLVDLVPKNIDELTLSLADECRNRDYARTMLHEFRQSRPRCLLTTNACPPDRSAMDCGRWYSYIGEMPSVVSNSSIRMEYLDPILAPGTIETTIFRGRACRDILRVEKTMRIANPDRIKEIEFPERASREDLIRVCRTYRSLRAVSLLGDQYLDDIKAVLQNTSTNCIVYVASMFRGEFSDDEIKRMRVHLFLLSSKETELTEIERNSVISLTCTNKPEDISLLTSLPNMRNLCFRVRYPIDLEFDPASLSVHEFKFYSAVGNNTSIIYKDTDISLDKAIEICSSIEERLAQIKAMVISPSHPTLLMQSVHTILEADWHPSITDERFTDFLSDFWGQLAFIISQDCRIIQPSVSHKKMYFEYVFPQRAEVIRERCDENGDQCIIVRQNAFNLSMLSNYTWEREADGDVFYNIEPDYYLDYFEDAYIGENVNAYRY